MSSLFGKRSQATSTSPTGFGTLPGFGQEAFRDVIQRGTALSEQPDLFRTPDLTAQQQQALDVLSSFTGPTTPEQFQAGISTFSDPFEEQVVQSAISDIERAGRGQLSDIASLASAAGGFGGTRQALLESELQRNIQQNIGDISGRLRSRGFEAAAGRTLSDLGRAQGAAGQLFGLGELSRGIQQQQQQAPLQAVSFLSNLAQGIPVGGGGQSRQVGGQASPLGTIGALAGGLGALFSDERLKENIEKVGEKNGYNIYEFNYLDQPERFRGVLAQEVFEKCPDAVDEIDGYLAVDYGRIGLEMERVYVI